MTYHGDISELPELSDEDVEILYAICKQASASAAPPFKALFAAYDEVFADQSVQQHRDDVLFRYLMRVGESTRALGSEGGTVDLIERLRNVLDAQGITVITPSDDGADDDVEVVSVGGAIGQRHGLNARRRVSFDDARLEETWLSENSIAARPIAPHPALPSTLNRALVGRRPETASRRARSISPVRALPFRNAAPKHFQHVLSKPVERVNATVLLEPSRTQLEFNAEAFLSTSSLRAARLALRLWLNATLLANKTREKSSWQAYTRDRCTLLKQALDQWRSALRDKRSQQKKLRQLSRLEERAVRYRNLFLITKAFTHWATSSSIERIRTAVAQRHVLKVTYFKRWRAITRENQARVRSILCKKYLAILREKLARRLLWQEQAIAYYEESLLRTCKTDWFWHFCSRRVRSWREESTQRKTMVLLRRSLHEGQIIDGRAETFRAFTLAWTCLRRLRDRSNLWRAADSTAVQQYRRIAISTAFKALERQVTLAPAARAAATRSASDLKSRVMSVLRLRLSHSLRAVEADRWRVLQTAWTAWNETLRCTALVRKVDERVLTEHLYRWVLHERLQLFQRACERRLLSRAFDWLLLEAQQGRNRLLQVELVFAERQRRVKLAIGMLRVNLAVRKREDAERAAIEAINARALPRILAIWKKKTDEAGTLYKMAADARFYFLGTSALKTWQTSTSEHKQNRRRNAYKQLRTKIKIRLVSQCFICLRTKANGVDVIKGFAEEHARHQGARVGSRAFRQWRQEGMRASEMRLRASMLDYQKLLRSAFDALAAHHSRATLFSRRISDFRHETNLALMASAMRSVQWAAFTTKRKEESAEALWSRNRQQHLKQMLRHWLAQTAALQETADDDEDASSVNETESPSLRPRSRSASRAAEIAVTSSSAVTQSTPAYLRTPSRPRRAGRFRLLATPAPFTPLAFDASLLVTDNGSPLADAEHFDDDSAFMEPTLRTTPFYRKLQAGGFHIARSSALRNPLEATAPGTVKSVRFVRASRFAGPRHEADDKLE